MEKNFENEFDAEEQKIYNALFNDEKNEYTKSISLLKQTFSKKIFINRKFPDVKELHLNENKIFHLERKNTMKKLSIILAAAAILIIGITVTYFQSQPKQEPQDQQVSIQAKVTFVSGEVTVKDETGKDKPKPTIGTILEVNDTIITGNKSAVEIDLGKGSSVRIKSNSEFSIKKLLASSSKTEQEVFLNRGMALVTVNKQTKEDTFNVVTPTVIAGVRGTKFQVEVNPKKDAKESVRVVVAEGTVGITKRNEQGLPATSEPIEILEAKEVIIEKGFGGELTKMQIEQPKLEQELSLPNDATTEKELLKTLGKTEIEKITLTNNKIIRGVIIDMNDQFFTIQTLDGIIKVAREDVISSESIKP
ncbi:MAG: FecR domain-containing protein [Leptospiraceae bacterium]|nr:FecR domain-containing protein [Leptospiraceae bacterium]